MYSHHTERRRFKIDAKHDLTKSCKGKTGETSTVLTQQFVPQDNYHKFCYRHNPDVTCNKQSDQLKMNELQQQLQKLPVKEQELINGIWKSFNSSNNRNLILQGLLAQCCFPQLSFISQEVSSLIRIDFITTLPLELSLKILCYLDCESLCSAAQVSKQWQKLADDDRVWHHLCEQHIDRKCPNCGWGLPLMHMKRAREIAGGHDTPRAGAQPTSQAAQAGPQAGGSTTQAGLQAGPQPGGSTTQPGGSTTQPGGSTTQPAKRRRLSNQTVSREGLRRTRPWKIVYSERFQVERNWRKGNYTMTEIRGHTDGVLCLKYDHKHLFTGSYDCSIKMWDVHTGQLVRSLESHTKGVKSLAFDEQKLITGSIDSTIKVWNYHTGQCISTYRGHTDAVLSVDFYKKFIVSGSADKTVKVWNVETRTCYALRGHTEPVNSVKIHPASQTVFSGSDDGTIRMWDFGCNKLLKVFRGHIAQVQKVIPLNIADDYELELDDVEGDDEHDSDDEPDEDNGVGLDLSDSSKQYPRYLLSASLDNTIKLWDVKTGKCVRTQFGHVEGIWDISADTFRIVSGAHDRFVKVWDLQSGKCMHTFAGHSNSVTCVGLGDSSFASGDENGVVRMYKFDNK